MQRNLYLKILGGLLVISLGFNLYLLHHKSPVTTIGTKTIVKDVGVPTAQTIPNYATDTDICTAVTYGIVTTAPAGSQTACNILQYSGTKASGNIAYQKSGQSTRFIATKDSSGKWQLTAHGDNVSL